MNASTTVSLDIIDIQHIKFYCIFSYTLSSNIAYSISSRGLRSFNFGSCFLLGDQLNNYIYKPKLTTQTVQQKQKVSKALQMYLYVLSLDIWFFCSNCLISLFKKASVERGVYVINHGGFLENLLLCRNAVQCQFFLPW